MPLRFRLNAMMFLEYAVKGLWFPLAGFFLTVAIVDGGLGFTQREKGLIIGVPMAIGAICAPFIAQICDRYLPTEKILAVLLFFTGIIKILLSYQNTFSGWMGFSIAFTILYLPTVSLTNSLAMRHLKDPKTQFPGVRVWGTIAWIAVGWGFSMIWLQHDLHFQWLPPFLKGIEHTDITARMLDSLKIAGVLCMVYAVFCWFILPPTPPVPNQSKKIVLIEALGLLRKRSFAILMLCGLAIATIHTIYFFQMAPFLKANGLDQSDIMPAMSIGQFSEIAVMGMLGLCLSKFGYRAVITFGALAYALRYGICAITDLPLSAYVSAQVIHGFCFAGFFAAAFIYVDRVAPPQIKNSAQTLFMLVMLGIGPLTASWLNGYLAGIIGENTKEISATGFAFFWKVNAFIALVTAVVFGLFFRDETAEAD